MRKFTFSYVAFIAVALAIELPCRYDGNKNSFSLPALDLYYCELKNNLNILNSSTQITSVTGEHEDQKTNANVVGFRAENKTMDYIPRGLDKFFFAEKIQFIEIQTTGLKEIHQSDLNPFTELKFFSAWGNELRVLERDLFKFNSKIRFIGLGCNQIKFIDGNVFKALIDLDTVYLDGNQCISEFVNSKESDDYKNELLDLSKSVREHCSPYYS